MDLANDLHQNNVNNEIVAMASNPAPKGSPIYLMVEEVPLDQLVGPRDEGFPEQEINLCKVQIG